MWYRRTVLVVTAGLLVLFMGACGGGSSSSPAPNPPAAVIPAPSLTTLDPPSAPAGSAGFTLKLIGSNFRNDSTVTWNGTAKPATFVSATEITIGVTATDLDAPRSVTVQVANPGSTAGPASASFVIGQPQPPVLSAIAPSQVSAGSASVTLTVNGNNFVRDSKVHWNGAARTTTYVNNSQLTAVIPQTDLLATGLYSVNVVTPLLPTANTSTTVPFQVGTSTTAPFITSITPAEVLSGSADTTLTFRGGNFLSGAKVARNGVEFATATFVSAQELRVVISASMIASGSTTVLTVRNPAPSSETSNPAFLTVYNPAPAVTSLTPSSLQAGGATTTVQLTGSGFRPDSTLLLGGAQRTFNLLSPTSLRFSLLDSDLSTARSIIVEVVNAAPGGGRASIPFTVGPAPPPVLTLITPTMVPVNGPGFTLELSGQDFVSTSKVQWDGVEKTTTYVTRRMLRAQIPASDLTSIGKRAVTVSTTPPGGVSSALHVQVWSTGTTLPALVSILPNGALTQDAFVGMPSANGRYVAFNNMVRDTCNGAAGCTPSTRQLPDSFSFVPELSADGRYTFAGNVPGPALRLYDTCAGTSACTPSTVEVSILPNGTSTPNSRFAGLTADARYVVFNDVKFLTNSAGFSTGDPDPSYANRVYLRDTCLGVATACTPSTSAVTPGTGLLEEARSVSESGRFILYLRDGVPFVRDTCLNAPAGCVATNFNVPIPRDVLGRLSPDGRYIPFLSADSTLVAGDTNAKTDVFLFDSCAGASAPCTPSTVRVSVATDGSQANDGSAGTASASRGGRFVAFLSLATNLDGLPPGALPVAYVRDTCLGAGSGCTPRTRMAFVPPANEYLQVTVPQLTPDGRFLVVGAMDIAFGDDPRVAKSVLFLVSNPLAD